MNILDWSVQLAGGDNAFHTANAGHFPLDRQVVLNTQTGQYKIGDGTSTLGALTYYGGSSSAYTGTANRITITGTVIDIGADVVTLTGSQALTNKTGNISQWTNNSGYLIASALTPYLTTATASATYQPIGSYLTGLTVATTTITGGTSTRILYNNAGVLGEYLVTGTGTTAVLSTSPTFTTNITTPSVILSGNISSAAWTTSGIGLRTVARTLTDTTSSGTVAAAYTNLLGGNTIAATSATTFTNYYATFISTPIAGANVIITNRWAAGFGGNVEIKNTVPSSSVRLRTQNLSTTGFSLNGVYSDDGASSASLAVFNTAGGVGSFYDSSTAGLSTNSALSFIVNERVNGGWVMTAGGFGSNSEMIRVLPIATTGAITTFSFRGKANTGQTASTNIPGFLFTTGSRQYATGAIATQTEFSITSPAYLFVAASVITNAFTLFVAAPTAGANATITNNYAIGTTGSVNIASGNLFNSGTQVLSTRDTGWTVFTGASNKVTSYATGSVTLIQLAERVAALQIALTTHGAIGA